MPQYVELIDQAEDKVFAGVKQIQDAIVTATGTLSQTVAVRLPEIPQLPFADQMPAPEWVVVRASRWPSGCSRASGRSQTTCSRRSRP